jgi:hypothetical protein
VSLIFAGDACVAGGQKIVINLHSVPIEKGLRPLGLSARVGGDGLCEVKDSDLRLVIVLADARGVGCRERIAPPDAGKNRLELRDEETPDSAAFIRIGKQIPLDLRDSRVF